MDKESNEKVSPIVTELFLRGMKLNISFVFFLSQSNFKVHKFVRLNTKNYFIMNIYNKGELQQVSI